MSTSRPHTTGSSSNIPPGQSPSKTLQVDSTNNQLAPQNLAQPLYQNNPNQQFIPNNIPLINPAQLQLQTQFQQIALMQRQQQLLQFQQQQQQQQQQLQQGQYQQQQLQQQSNSSESQLKNQQHSNGQIPQFHNLPELFNLFQLLQSNQTLPLAQLSQTQAIPPVQQQPTTLQTLKTMTTSPSKLSQSQHTPRSCVTSPQSGVTVSGMNNNNAQMAEIHSGTSLIRPIVPSAENLKLLLTSPTVSDSSMASPSSITSRLSEEIRDEVKEQTSPTIKKNVRDEITPNKSFSSPDIAQDCITPPEVNKSPLPRRKQTNVTNISPIKANPIISPVIPSGSINDSLIPSTPKKTLANATAVSPSTPVGNVSSVLVTSTTSGNKVKQIKKEPNVPKPTETVKPEPKSPSKAEDPKPSTSKSKSSTSHLVEDLPVSLDDKLKRHRFKTIPFQSPTPDLVLATKMSVTEAYGNSANTKDKLIVFYKNEFLAVRNDEGSYFLCQCHTNVSKSTKKCIIRWLNKVDDSDDIYKISYHDKIDMECILTSLELDELKGNKFKLARNEQERIENILKKSLDVEKGLAPPEVTEGHPDGLDISLYKSESQLEVKSEESSPAPKRKMEHSSKSAIPEKKLKKTLKSSKKRSQSRAKNSSSSETTSNYSPLKKNGTSARPSNKTSRPNSSRRSMRSLSSSSSPSFRSSNDKEESLKKQTTKPKDSPKTVVDKKVTKTKTVTKSPVSSNKSPPSSSERLRKRSNK